MQLFHRRTRHAEGVREGPQLSLRVHRGLGINFTDTTLVLLELLVAEAVLPHAEAGIQILFVTEALLDLVTEGVGRGLRRREASSLAESKLLLGSRAVADGSFADLVASHVTLLVKFDQV